MAKKKGWIKLRKNYDYFGKPEKDKSSTFVDLNLEKATRGVFAKSKGAFLETDNEHQSPLALKILGYSIFAVAIIFVLRLFFLTVVQGVANKEIADNNRIRLVESEALRGKILDRNGKILGYSEKVYKLKKGETVSEITAKQAMDLLNLGLAYEDYEGELGQVLTSVLRKYSLNYQTSHLLGYLKRESESKVIGQSGLESTYDNFLQGVVGKKLIEVDASGKKVSIMAKSEPVDGGEIYTTVDVDLQKVAYEALLKQVTKVKTNRGAVIVSDVNTGGILALVSLPAFDSSNIEKSLTEKDKPFFNRAIGGNYPPGSVFKIVSALAALENGVIDKNTEIEDVGEFKIANDKFVNWYFILTGRRDGIIKIDKAIARSNDIFFYRIAEKLGLEPLRKMALKLGFGTKTGIDLPEENFGLVPSEQWKQSTQNTSWYLGDTLHLAIGQGFLLATPLQINTLTNFSANGKVVKPFIVSKIKPSANESEIAVENKIIGENLVSNENLQIVRSGMRQACETGGTGWPFFDSKYKVGCKTGTAEQTLGNPHAWFTAYAPLEAPKISVTVLVEDGGEGSSVAGPVAKEILDWYFNNRK